MEIKVRRALLSVSDKSGLEEFARELARHGVELVSTGGTARALTEAGLSVRPVESLTGFPEMMDGRLKTLHPKVHGGILAIRGNTEHERAMREHGIEAIDLVCVNLYPFRATIAKPGVTREEAIENIDIGGPAMIRAAAKNHEFVAVITSPSQYGRVLAEMESHRGGTTHALRGALAAEAFGHTSGYDRAIGDYLRAGEGAPGLSMPHLEKAHDLRYGENPHQSAALLADQDYSGPSVVNARQLHGKELSYNNLNDAAAALALALDLRTFDAERESAAIIKHANPCGAATAGAARDAVALALAGDPIAAYGGILAMSGTFDEACAEVVCAPGVFLEVIVAQAFTEGALERMKAKSAGVRLLETGRDVPAARSARVTFKSIPGGALVQSADDSACDPCAWVHAAGPPPSDRTRREAGMVWIAAKHLSSNAVAIGGADPSMGGVRLFGAGAGQMDRVTACRLAVEKAGERARGAIAASDAFFPFPDGPELLIRAGVTTIVHPGGSKRDQETFDLCKAHGVTCLTTGVRHFRH